MIEAVKTLLAAVDELLVAKKASGQWVVPYGAVRDKLADSAHAVKRLLIVPSKKTNA